MIKYKRIYECNDNIYKILIDRMWPRGIKKDKIDMWLKDIAPSKGIITKYHKDNNYEEFKEEYFKELDNKKDKLKEIINLSKEKDIVLVYSSKREKNNMTALKEYIEKDMI